MDQSNSTYSYSNLPSAQQPPPRQSLQLVPGTLIGSIPTLSNTISARSSNKRPPRLFTNVNNTGPISHHKRQPIAGGMIGVSNLLMHGL